MPINKADRDRRRRQEDFQSWVRIAFRDIASPSLGIAILAWETMVEQADRPWLIVAALTLLGYPFADRVDKWLKGAKNGNGNGAEK